MKRYVPYIIVCLLALCTSCQQDETIVYTESEGNLQISINTGYLSPQAVTRTSPGDDNYNENKLTRVDCFFYPANGGNAEPLHQIIGYQFAANTTQTGTITNSIPENVIEQLFPSGANTCLVYIIANRPTDVPLPNSRTINSLKGLLISGDFIDQEVQADFVMDGQGEVTFDADAKQVSGNIDLYRAASKIALFVTNVSETVTDDAGVIWTSNPADMKILLHDGVSKGRVDATQVPYTVQDADYFEFTVNNARAMSQEATTQQYTSAPFYSYSSDWSTDTEHEAFFTLLLPWKRAGEEVYQTCYYQIPINSAGRSFVRNHYYRINLEVGILGAFESTEQVQLTPSYVVINWGTAEVEAELNQHSYLMVETNKAEMPNISSFTQSFASSHKITVTIDKIEYPNYQNATTRKVTITPSGKTVTPTGQSVPNDGVDYGDYTVTVDEDANTFTLTHTIPAATTYVPHDIYMTVTNEVGMEEKVHYTWYPPIYVKGELTTRGTVFVNETKHTNVRNENGDNTKDSNGLFLGGLEGYDYVTGTNSTNNNQNTYTMYVTSLPGDSKFYIGDPRAAAENMTGLKRTPISYRRTDKNAGNMIAPAFKIASSYGKTWDVTYEGAVRRCASYQENGYPAGRWRVPTEGEIDFITARSLDGDIPSLFGDTENNNNAAEYWAASGRYYNYQQNSTDNFKTAANNGQYAVRCVYDVWYWGDSKINELNENHSNSDAHWSVEYE